MLGVSGDAREPARAPRPQPRQADHIQPAGLADPPVMTGIAILREAGHIDPGPVTAKPGGPDDRAHAGRLEVKRPAAAVGAGLPNRAVALLDGSGDALLGDPAIDRVL